MSIESLRQNPAQQFRLCGLWGQLLNYTLCGYSSLIETKASMINVYRCHNSIITLPATVEELKKESPWLHTTKMPCWSFTMKSRATVAKMRESTKASIKECLVMKLLRNTLRLTLQELNPQLLPYLHSLNKHHYL